MNKTENWEKPEVKEIGTVTSLVSGGNEGTDPKVFGTGDHLSDSLTT